MVHLCGWMRMSALVVDSGEARLVVWSVDHAANTA